MNEKIQLQGKKKKNENGLSMKTTTGIISKMLFNH